MNRYFLCLMVGLLSWVLAGNGELSVLAQENEAPAAEKEDTPAAKKKTTRKKTTKKKSTKKKAEADEEEEAAKPKRATRKAVKKDDAAAQEAAEEETLMEEAEQEVADAPTEEMEEAAEETLKTVETPEEVAEETAPEEMAEESTEEAVSETPRRGRRCKLVNPGTEAGEQETITVNKVKYTFCWCPAGKFQMGSPEDEPGHTAAEKQHEVTISKGFWMLKTEVTQGMYQSLMGKNPSYFSPEGFGRNSVRQDGKPMDTKDFPVERVSWNDAQVFCETFSEQAGATFTLPTEAQWEYACRAGTTTPYYTGSEVKRSDANYNLPGKEGNLDRTEKVGSFGENPWRLCDMMGNVSEWCNDLYDAEYYNNSPATDPTGPEGGSGSHVLRGGNWNAVPYYCRSASRNFLNANYNYGHYYDGFRIVCVAGEDAAEATQEAMEETVEEVEDSEE